MQSLDVISVNIWQILISLANLLILFLMFKKFLFKPVNNMLEKRQSEIDAQYEAAEEAKRSAQEDKLLWDEKMETAKAQADEIINKAQNSAKRQGEAIVTKAKDTADSIVRQAENQAQLEIKKAEDGIKKEIVEEGINKLGMKDTESLFVSKLMDVDKTHTEENVTIYM